MYTYDYTVPPLEMALVKTNIQTSLSSGLAAKYFTDAGAGVTDED